ncbi:hypothetical protein PDESU_05454 [Pontiella desulfatans]|uniref:Uncharacterized protein n=1 Tax=Pontiella desulfatans TaxID=2750659 RepID=A0A6C2U9T2_PONDE|nr:hypothetical protein PDESU_05454 [Pontiella desulfatans]
MHEGKIRYKSARTPKGSLRQMQWKKEASHLAGLRSQVTSICTIVNLDVTFQPQPTAPILWSSPFYGAAKMTNNSFQPLPTCHFPRFKLLASSGTTQERNENEN